VSQVLNVLPRPDARALTVNLKRESDFALQVWPWMFRTEQVIVTTKYRAVPDRPYPTIEDFRFVYRGAPERMASFQLRGE
jgi:hypothetical protein